MRVMSAGDGFRYLLRTVAAGDGNRALGTPLTRYYTEKGTPPGYWLGTGVAGLGEGGLQPGAEVTETQLRLLLGEGRDPVTGEPLGRPWPSYRTVAERIRARVGSLPSTLEGDERSAAASRIELEEKGRQRRRAVAGFDFTFSVPKSVSTLWALADGGAQAAIVGAHHAAVAEVIGLLEREVAMTRIGADAGDGSVAQVEVRGVVATGYDHYDSRSSDPQLHTHVVIANKVQAVVDGKWRTLDGRPLHAAVVALSEHYNAVLADHLTRDLGLRWEMRERGADRNPSLEIAAVSDALMGEFSSRSHQIEAAKNELIADYLDKHGRRPSSMTMLRLRAEATLRTRPDKTVHSLADLTTEWRTRADQVLGEDSSAWAARQIARDRDESATLHAADLSPEVLQQVGRTVVQIVGEKRATWRRWNLHAETSRQLMPHRFATTADRETILDAIVEAAERASVRLTPPELASSPASMQRADGTSVFRPKHGAVFTSAELLAAEDHLLELAHTTSAPRATFIAVQLSEGRRLADDQATAIRQIGASGRTVDVLLGPAGTGKTTALSGLRTVWEAEHGAWSVVGVAPSAAAAQVLADELGIPTENTAKWVHAHNHNGWILHAGQLLIVDEASLAGTLTLNTLASHAADVGAKVLLVGDWAQLSAVESGGAFGMLARSIDGPPELTEVRRFRNDWEKDASLQVRAGDPAVISSYQQHDRVHGGDLDEMLDVAYTAWRADIAAGKASVMIAETVDTVTALNERARLDRVATGQVNPKRAVSLHRGTEASRGDLVITRRNDRTLITGAGWVKNNDRWIITATHSDGSITVQRANTHANTCTSTGGTVRLPASYVAKHLELGYAITAHRAQGTTVDTAHAVVHSSQMTRETFYVAMTRGREANSCYVATDQTHLEQHHQNPEAEVTVEAVLTGVLNHVGAEQSAHETITAEQNTWGGIAQLAAEYDTIATIAQHGRWVALLERSGLTAVQVEGVTASESFGTLATELRLAEAHHHDLNMLVPLVVSGRELRDADDIGAVLRHRLRRVTAATIERDRRRVSATAPRLIVGLIAEAAGPMTAAERIALAERAALITARASTVVDAALDTGEPWIRTLGPVPIDPYRRALWSCQAQVIAAYRDRYKIKDSTPMGGSSDTELLSDVQREDFYRARAALSQIRRLNDIKDVPSVWPSSSVRRGNEPPRL